MISSCISAIVLLGVTVVLLSTSTLYKVWPQPEQIHSSATGVTVGLLSTSAVYTVWLQPEQIHLSATGDSTEMMVTWSTFSDTVESTVKFGSQMDILSMNAIGNRTKFVDGGAESHTQFIHRVKVTGLKTGSVYYYRCGSLYGWSSVYKFKALPDYQQAAIRGVRFALYGDLDYKNAQSLPRLQVEAQSGYYDFIAHVGDFAYDMASDNAEVGDEFMRQIETAAAYVPYMTTPGNHENAYNFSNYKNRFTMPMYEKVESLWYSWNIGKAHIISFSSEVNFYTKFGKDQIKNQMAWLQADLAEATAPENQTKHPWIITMGHRPMYCSNADKTDCTKKNSVTRLAFEDLFYKYGVDVEIWAHEHSYERLWPIYNYKIYNGSMETPYTNPKAPIHITTGSAGCREKHSPFSVKRNYTAFRAVDYGYSRMWIVNSTHIDMEQVSDDKGGQIIDKFTIIKDQHGPKAWL